MRERREGLGDAVLRLSPSAPWGLRRQLARKAAARGLSRPALRAAAGDPVVLARLGLHFDAMAARGGGAEGAAAMAASAAALGDLAPARTLLRSGQKLSRDGRRLLARCMAPIDPALALEVLPAGDIPAQAACALAAGQNDRLQQLLRHAPASRETLVIGAALAARLGDWRTARRKLNATFAIDGMTAPLNESVEGQIGLGSFAEADSIDLPGGTGGADRPRISIVIPARNAQGTLALAVRSLLKQTWQNLEVLIVDDRSTDRTPDIAWDLARADPRTKVVSNRRTAGPFGARNSGVDAATGEFIAFHDADDWAHPQRLEWQMRALGRRDGLSVTRYFRLDARGQPVSPRVFPLVRLSPIAMVVRAEAWRAAGSFEEVPLGADSEWLARFDERFGRRQAARMPAVCMVARWAAGSLSASPTTGMEGEGLMRRIRYETDWRWRHAGLAGAPGAKGQPRLSAFASFAGTV